MDTAEARVPPAPRADRLPWRGDACTGDARRVDSPVAARALLTRPPRDVNMSGAFVGDPSGRRGEAMRNLPNVKTLILF
jgi:hypothetical protein